MNCKPGDLVRYVGSNPFGRPNPSGWIGKVVRISPLTHDGLTVWVVDPPMAGGVKRITGLWSDGSELYDHLLRRIDNPGDDAVDEVIQRIGTPHKEVA